CASVFTGTRETISADSSPSGADATLFCGETRVGTALTRAKFTIRRNAGDCTLTISKSGFVARTASIEQGINPAYWANFISVPAAVVAAFYGGAALIVYGGLPLHGSIASGFVIDSASGAMHTHRPHNVRIELQPEVSRGRDSN